MYRFQTLEISFGQVSKVVQIYLFRKNGHNVEVSKKGCDCIPVWLGIVFRTSQIILILLLSSTSYIYRVKYREGTDPRISTSTQILIGCIRLSYAYCPTVYMHPQKCVKVFRHADACTDAILIHNFSELSMTDVWCLYHQI